MKKTHTHRILPGHQGGEYTEGNKIEVLPVSCGRNTASHCMWHWANYFLLGKEEDKIAAQGLAGFLNKEEVIAAAARLGGDFGGISSGGRVSKDNQKGIFDPEYRSSEEYREMVKNAGSSGGSVGKGGESSRDKKVGIFGVDRSTEEYSTISRNRGKMSVESGRGIFQEGYFSSEEGRLNQRNNGKLAAAATNSKRYRCTVSGYESTGPGLTMKQKFMGIDPSNRERIK